MADEVVARCLAHIESLPAQPAIGDIDAGALCRAMREPAPEHGAALESLLDPLFDDRFPAIPMYSGRPWFLPLVGAYYQVKDWLQ